MDRDRKRRGKEWDGDEMCLFVTALCRWGAYVCVVLYICVRLAIYVYVVQIK